MVRIRVVGGEAPMCRRLRSLRSHDVFLCPITLPGYGSPTSRSREPAGSWYCEQREPSILDSLFVLDHVTKGV